MSINVYGGRLTGSTMDSVGGLSVNMTEGHFVATMQALGYVIDEHCGHIEIDKFLSVARGWLQRNINKPSQPLTPRDYTGAGGCRIIEIGVQSGYVNRRVHDIVTMLASAQEQGATFMYWG